MKLVFSTKWVGFELSCGEQDVSVGCGNAADSSGGAGLRPSAGEFGLSSGRKWDRGLHWPERAARTKVSRRQPGSQSRTWRGCHGQSILWGDHRRKMRIQEAEA